jgi:PST family polysaccharide transporter
MGLLAVFNVWAARSLGPEYFGSLVLATTVVALLTPLTETGQTVLLRRITNGLRKDERVLPHVRLAIITGCLLVVVVAPIVVLIVATSAPRSFPALQLTLVAAAISLLLRPALVIDYLLQAKTANYVSAGIRFAGTLAGSSLRLYALAWPHSASTSSVLLASAVTVDVGVVAVGYILYLASSRSTDTAPAIERVSLIGYIKEVSPLLLTSAAIIFYMRIDAVMLSYLSGPLQVAAYGAALRVTELWFFLPMVLGQIFGPRVLSASLPPGRQQLSRQAERFLGLVSLLSLVLALGLLASASLLVGIFGAEYLALGADDMVRVLALSLPFVFMSVWQLYISALDSTNHLAVIRAILAAAANLLLNFILIPSIGGYGAAIATVVTYALAGVLLNAMNQRTRYVLKAQLRALNPVLALRMVTGGKQEDL